MRDFKYIYGPVPSWRLGSSLGIDPISREDKICSFNCIYCQLGSGGVCSVERKIYVHEKKIIEELKSLPDVRIDYITFSGRGEPTLAANLGQAIRAVKALRKERVAVITNSSLMDREDVRRDLAPADFVIAKLDACSQELFAKINRPAETVKFDSVVEGIKKFKNVFKGKLALQVMFVGENSIHAREIARIAREINPDEVQFNTPLRPCGCRPLPKEELEAIKGFFEGMNIISVYETEKKNVRAISGNDTLRRRGKV